MSNPTSGPGTKRAFGRDTPMSIAGVGAVTGYGWGKQHLWDGFLLGESAVKLTTGLDGFVDGGYAYLSLIPDEGDRKDGPSRFMQALRFSAREAISEALERGWEPGPGGRGHPQHRPRRCRDVERVPPVGRAAHPRASKWVNMMPSTVLCMFMKECDFHGPGHVGFGDVRVGQRGPDDREVMARLGVASDVILLATDLSGIPENLRGFSDLGVAVLDRPPFDGCRPFQEGSRGFVGGEAAVAMVLIQPAAGAYATVLGGAMTMDAYNAVAMAPDLNEVFRCFREALEVSRSGRFGESPT